MGQLEKYGLYVLCLVIFLILGVTIWGEDAPVVPAAKQQTLATSSGKPAGPASAAQPSSLGNALDLLLGDDPKPPPKNAGRAPADGGDTGTELAADRGAPPPPAAAPSDPPKDQPPPAAATVVYTVQKGDTFESLARKKLGTATAWREIQRLNPTIEPQRLRAGDEIVLPTTAALAARASARGAVLGKPLAEAPAGKRLYTVKKGDNYERIARAELGSSRRWKEVHELNPQVDPAKLQLGMRLRLPAK